MKKESKKIKKQGFFSSLQGRIAIPPRQGRLDSLLILFSVALFSGTALWPREWFHWLLIPLLPVLTFGWVNRSAYVTHAALIGFVFIAIFGVPQIFASWPLPIVLILIASGLLVAVVPWLRSSLGWMKWGVPDKFTWRLTAVFTVIGVLGVTAWRYLAHPDLGPYKPLVPHGFTLWLLPIGIVLYAALNAFYEEVVWRRVFMQSLEAVLGPVRLVLLTPAAGF